MLDNVKLKNEVEKKNITASGFFRSYFPYILLVLLFVIFSVSNSKFAQLSNIMNILEQSGVLLVVGMGMTFVIIAGGIDLSVGSVLGLTASISAICINAFGPAGVLIGILIGGVCGLVSGVIYVKAKIPSFIVTLGMMTIVRGILLIITGGMTVLIKNNSIRSFSNGRLFFVPNVFLIFIFVFIICLLLFDYTSFGVYARAIGGNEEVARFSGIDIDWVKIKIFLLSGMTAGIGGVLSAIRLGASSPNLGQGFELNVIGAVVLGGTALSGGTGKLIGTVIGALIMGMLNNGLNVIGVNAFIQMVVRGIVVIVAVILTIDRKKLSGIVK